MHSLSQSCSRSARPCIPWYFIALVHSTSCLLSSSSFFSSCFLHRLHIFAANLKLFVFFFPLLLTSFFFWLLLVCLTKQGHCYRSRDTLERALKLHDYAHETAMQKQTTSNSPVNSYVKVMSEQDQKVTENICKALLGILASSSFFLPFFFRLLLRFFSLPSPYPLSHIIQYYFS